MTSVASPVAGASRFADSAPTTPDAPRAGHAPTPSAVADAYAQCERIARASSSSFSVAFRLLPVERRRALAALYAYCRLIDDAADEGADPVAALTGWRTELTRLQRGEATHPVMVALADAAQRFMIPTRHLEDILTGVEMDLTPPSFDTFAELERYCYHVAVAVGLAALPIFGCRDLKSREYAHALGTALQLTNILRDLAEDAERGRIYLPREDLRRFGYETRDLHTHVHGDALRALVTFEVSRARALYRVARANVAVRDRRALVAAEAMRLVYQRLLARIAADPDAVFGPRIRVPLHEKALCVMVAWLRSRGAAR